MKPVEPGTTLQRNFYPKRLSPVISPEFARMLEEGGACGEDKPVELRTAVRWQAALVKLDQSSDAGIFITRIIMAHVLLCPALFRVSPYLFS